MPTPDLSTAIVPVLAHRGLAGSTEGEVTEALATSPAAASHYGRPSCSLIACSTARKSALFSVPILPVNRS
jgi:hypothetical protein